MQAISSRHPTNKRPITNQRIICQSSSKEWEQYKLEYK